MNQSSLLCPCSTPDCLNEGVYFYENLLSYACSGCESTLFSGEVKIRIWSLNDLFRKSQVVSNIINIMEEYITKKYWEELRERGQTFLNTTKSKLSELDWETNKVKDDGTWNLLNTLEVSYESCLDEFKRDPEYLNYLIHQNLSIVNSRLDLSSTNPIEVEEVKVAIEEEVSSLGISSVSSSDLVSESDITRFTVSSTQETVLDPCEEEVAKLQEVEEAKVIGDEEGIINHEITTLSNQLFNQAYLDITGVEVDINEEWKFKMVLNEEKDWKFFKFLLGHKMPNWKYLSLRAVPERSIEVKQFLLNSFPDWVRDFNFNFMSEKKDVAYYLEGLEHVFPKIEMELNLYHLKISNKELWKLLQANKNRINWIGFIECQLCHHFDFGRDLEGANFKGLSLSGSKFPDSNDWENHPERFSNLIQALGKVQSVREGMDRIWLSESGLEEEFVRNILDNHGLDRVEIKKHSL